MSKKFEAFRLHTSFSFLLLGISLISISLVSGCNSAIDNTAIELTGQTGDFDGINNTSMFDGQNLGLWEQSDFFSDYYEQGRVYVEDGCIVLEKSELMTGVTWTGPFQKTDYQIYFEAMRPEGDDFFCTLTFPAGETSCSLVVGGWTNNVIGISNIGNKSANENETSIFANLLNNTWYRVYLSVSETRIQAWIDEIPVVNLYIGNEDKDLNVRTECEPSMPLGIATYKSTGMIRNIHYYLN